MIVDAGNFALRRYTNNSVSTFAGMLGTQGTNDSPQGGFGFGAQFTDPIGIAASPLADGGFYLTDGNRIRRVSVMGDVKTIAGTVDAGSADGKGGIQVADPLGGPTFVFDSSDTATFQYPDGIAVGADGALFVADTFNHAIRKIR
ncbi:NHL repeat protein [compost metagenome]